MAFQIDAMLVSLDTTTKGGGRYVLIFVIKVFPFEYESQTQRAFCSYSNDKTALLYAISR